MVAQASQPGDRPLPSRALEALNQDALLPICVACGTQYSAPREDCPICEDPRQFVPVSGQAWTSLAELRELSDGKRRRNTLEADHDDERVVFIGTEPSFAIGQTPILLKTAGGSYIWDSSAYLSAELVSHLSSLDPPLKGMAISHPHFFNTSLVWSRALHIPLYLNEADKEWFQRLSDITAQDKVVWWRNELELGPGVKVIECGGHFPGSSVLHWDRALEPNRSPASSSSSSSASASTLSTEDDDHKNPKTASSVHSASNTGLLLTADTLMVQPHRKGFTFIWSAPNMVPLDPHSTLRIQRVLKTVPFGQASSSWKGRFIRENARDILAEGVRGHLEKMGWQVSEDGVAVPLT